VRLFGVHVPFTKQTDQNTVTPIRPMYAVASPWGTIVEAFGGMWSRHLQIDNAQAILAFSAVFSCVSLISKDIGKLRPRLMKRDAEKIWTEIDNPASPILRRPNRFQTRNQFWEYWLLSKLIHGNTFVLKDRNEEGLVEALYILDPRRVMPLVSPDGSVFYQLQSDNLAGLEEGAPKVPASEIIHDRHTCLWHPLVGVGPLYACGASATQGNRIQQNSALFFGNMSRPSGQLTTAGHISDETAARLKRDFEDNFGGTKIGSILVTGDDLKFQPFTIPAESAQLIEQQRWTVEDVARAFGVPLYKIGAGSTPALSNISALNQEYYQQTLQPHIEGIETLMDDGLGLGAGLGIEFDLDGLLRMDPKSRAEVHEIGVRSATLMPNEARLQENRPPSEGGNALYLQQQNYSLPALAKRDASDDPFASEKKPAAPPPPANDPEAGAEDDAEAVRSTISRFRSREWRANSRN
jgi:HK97 family phage portal protein